MQLIGQYVGNRFLILLSIIGICVVSIYIGGRSLAQNEQLTSVNLISGVKSYSASNTYNLDSLRTLYGRNKKFVAQYEVQSLLALSHYPQLQETHIAFYEDEAFIPLASRPEPLSMLAGKDKWKYNIIISTATTSELSPVLLKNVPFNAQVGIIGHELAHTVSYLDKDVKDMLLIAFNYPFPAFRSNFEKNTDRRAIAHGLGWQLLDYAHFARKAMAYDETYLGSDYYLSPEDILEQMDQTDSR